MQNYFELLKSLVDSMPTDMASLVGKDFDVGANPEIQVTLQILEKLTQEAQKFLNNMQAEADDEQFQARCKDRHSRINECRMAILFNVRKQNAERLNGPSLPFYLVRYAQENADTGDQPHS